MAWLTLNAPFSCAVIGLDCWETNDDALASFHIVLSSPLMSLYVIIIAINIVLLCCASYNHMMHLEPVATRLIDLFLYPKAYNTPHSNQPLPSCINAQSIFFFYLQKGTC